MDRPLRIHMDKEASILRFRSPLSIIVNSLQPCSTKRLSESSLYNSSIVDSTDASQNSIPTEYVFGDEPPQLETAQEVHLVPCISTMREDLRRSPHNKSYSLNVHHPTQLGSIAEIPTRTSSLLRTRHRPSHSLDENRVPSHSFHKSISSERANWFLTAKRQSTRLSGENEETPRSLVNTAGTVQYHIPLPPRGLCERLEKRPSPERLSWERRVSGTSADFVAKGVGYSLDGAVWQGPNSKYSESVTPVGVRKPANTSLVHLSPDPPGSWSSKLSKPGNPVFGGSIFKKKPKRGRLYRL